MNALKRSLLFYILCFVVHNTIAIDNHHFYRASNFFPVFLEPRLCEDGLSSFDVYFSGGRTDKSAYGCSRPFNLCHNRDCLLNICGYANIQALGINIPNFDPTNPVDQALNALALLPTRENFANLSFLGHFSIFEADLFYTQNIVNGFFVQIHAPFRRLKIACVEKRDLSPNDNLFPNRNTPEWTTFLGLYNQFLDRFQLSTSDCCDNFVGDTTVLFGWTGNYDDTEILDFFDMSVRVGVLIPTGKKADPNFAFDLPTGYNGLVGIPVTFDAAFGLYDWVTLGMHFGVLPFTSTTQSVRVPTSPDQTGLLKLQTIRESVKGGLLWDAVGYFKADHICRGLSFTLGYTFADKKANKLIPPVCDCEILSCTSPVCTSPNLCSPALSPCACVESCDLINSAWNMQTVHIFFEYDFTAHDPIFMCPRLGLFVNVPVGGKRIFDTPTGGFSTGFDLSWCF